MKKDCRTCEYHSGHMIKPLIKGEYNLHSCSYEFDSRKAEGLEVVPLMIKNLKSLKACENYSYKTRYDDKDMREIRIKLEKQLANEGVK